MALRDQLRVLVVDDMSTSRGLITQALDSIGIGSVTTAADGASALESVANSPVHLVISDFNMPGMDGLELLKELRQGSRTSGVGFLLITGRADSSIIERGRNLRMNNYIAKPFQPMDLKIAIEAIVGRL